MAWQTPKTDWTTSDGISTADLNRIEGDLETLQTIEIGGTLTAGYASNALPAGFDFQNTVVVSCHLKPAGSGSVWFCGPFYRVLNLVPSGTLAIWSSVELVEDGTIEIHAEASLLGSAAYTLRICKASNL